MHRKKAFLQNGRLCDSTGRLAGTHVGMEESIENIINSVGVVLSIALSTASTRAIGLDHDWIRQTRLLCILYLVQ